MDVKYTSFARAAILAHRNPAAIIVGLVVFSVRSSLADWNDVPSGSMKPTILEGDRVFINKLAYDLKVPFTTGHIAEWANPERGEIVVFYSPHDGKRLIKRVVGVPGDTVELRENMLVINGKPVEYRAVSETLAADLASADQVKRVFVTELLPGQPHAVAATPSLPALRSFGPYTVPEDHYFMLGDNRDDSYDSRYWGFVKRDQILGHATSVVLSFDRNRHWQPRWNRFFSSLDATAK